MAIFVSDSFTDTSGTDLASHTGETGASWTLHPNGNTRLVISDAGRCRTDGTASIKLYYASGVPGSADYEVAGTLRQVSDTGGHMGLVARVDPAANTMYRVRYIASSNQFQFHKVVAGTSTSLGTSSLSASNGDDIPIALRCEGDQISVKVNGVTAIGPVTDTAITAAGRAGIYGFSNGSDTDGTHLDNFTATDIGGGGGAFQPAWARGSNVMLQPGMPG